MYDTRSEEVRESLSKSHSVDDIKEYYHGENKEQLEFILKHIEETLSWYDSIPAERLRTQDVEETERLIRHKHVVNMLLKTI